MDCENSLSSSSSSRRVWKYGVFLSFSGQDTRYNFTDHLSAALYRKRIKTYLDDEPEEGFSLAATQAIEQSRIFIIVFSTNYAASVYCLENLAKIAECIDSEEQIVLPVFYDVDPSLIKQQKGLYQEAFAQHEKTFKENLGKVERWRKCMTKVANLPGWDVRNRAEAEVIDKIVKRIIWMLYHKFSIVVDSLVGMQSRVEAFEKLLEIGSDDVTRVVGICGMGGIGKTALASVVYGRIFHQFDVNCFLANVSEVSAKHNGLFRLQNQLLYHTLEVKDLMLRHAEEGSLLIRTRLRHLKTLLVLDDVDSLGQLEKLAGNSDWFGAGSRIIVTSRDEHILKRFGVDEIYKVELLNNDEALQLLCRKAFHCDYPSKDFEELTWSALEYVKGLPLATVSLGSSLYGRSVSEWRNALQSLQKFPNRWVMEVLRRSFKGLPLLEKGIFLDIACFFEGEEIKYVKEILSYCGFYPDIGIQILIEKSLLTISNQRICMHDMVREMGRQTVRQESPEEPGYRSRLWLYDDFCHVMETKRANENVEAVVINNQEDPEVAPLRVEALSKLVHLRLLILRNVKFIGCLKDLSNFLGYVSWHEFPFTSLPSSFEPHKLVELTMPRSNITHLWEGIKILPKLRSMNLSYSKDLVKMPDFKGLPNLERLYLEGCTGLSQLDPSIAILQKLKFLKLRNCKNLISIPNSLFDQSSIETLDLAGCSKLAGYLKFDPLRSSLEVKLLINQCPFHKKFLYYVIISLSEDTMNRKLVFNFLSWLVDSKYVCNERR